MNNDGMGDDFENQDEVHSFKKAFGGKPKFIAKLVGDGKERHAKASVFCKEVLNLLKEHKAALDIMTFDAPPPGRPVKLPEIVLKIPEGDPSLYASLEYMAINLEDKLKGSKHLPDDNQTLAYLTNEIEALCREGKSREVNGLDKLKKTNVTPAQVSAAMDALHELYDLNKDFVNQHYEFCRGD